MQNAKLPETLHPVTFEHLQRVMNDLGYGLERLDHGSKVIHWVRDIKSDKQHSGPRLLTTLMPDFACDGFEHAVYDRHYVVDLLMSAVLGDFDKDGKLLRALITQHHERSN